MAVTDRFGNPVRDSKGNPVRSGNTAATSTNAAKSQARNTKLPTGGFGGFIGNVATGIGNTVKGIAEDIFDADNFGSLLRGFNLPGNAMPGLFGGSSTIGWQGADDDDWRVKVSMPPNLNMPSYFASKLSATNGLVFPYTPQIVLSHSASYNQVKPTHSNYPFPAYINSQPDTIQIVGEFYVEDADEGIYWAAAVHFCRSITKMAYGNTSFKGSPPPIVQLNGYGDYVLKNVPCVALQFTVDLPVDVDYIHVPEPVNTWVPTRSTLSLQLQPAYSRRSVQAFSLDKFVNGGYAKGNGPGFI